MDRLLLNKLKEIPSTFNIDFLMLFESLAKTTGFRNRFSQEYDKLDKRIRIKSFNLLLENYKKYLETIKNLI
jgi:uncharacterized protein YutE (UPF0331/DUF86 family)